MAVAKGGLECGVLRWGSTGHRHILYPQHIGINLRWALSKARSYRRFMYQSSFCIESKILVPTLPHGPEIVKL
jgi:hypothetical protein